VFFPNSTVNAGRNRLLQQLITQFPHVHPNFVIFMDEDARLEMRGDVTCGSAYDAHREFEKSLLKWQPAVGVPYQSWHSLQPQLVMQTLNHFDHNVVALHDEAVYFDVLTEALFVDMCWWYGQSIFSVIGSVFSPNITLQFNASVSINTGQRPSFSAGVAEVSSKYNKRLDCYPALLWIMSSAKSLSLLNNIRITRNASLFTYGTLANKRNRCSAATAAVPLLYLSHSLLRFLVANRPSVARLSKDSRVMYH
jgi:hypothetical protein